MENHFKFMIGTFLLLLHLCLLCVVTVHSVWPNKRSSIVPGDLYLAGFFPIHEIDSVIVCGKIEEEGLQQLETFMFTIKTINEDQSILPNITLGLIGLDGCDSNSHVLEVAMEFLGGFLASDSKFRETLSCPNGLHPYRGIYNRLAGVIGGRSSRVSIQLANLLRVFKIPQVSHKSNAMTLSNKKKYEYFFRTVSPISHQVKALLEIIKAFNWTYISVVYSDSAYGNDGFESLQVFAARENICFATQQRVNVETFKDTHYDAVLEALMKEKATGVVVFGEQLLAKNVMSASTRKGVLNRFVWLGSEAWGSRDYAVKEFKAAAEGALCVAYIIKPPPGFVEYFRSLTPDNANDTNPWFYEFWERQKKCKLPGYDITPHTNYSEPCSGSIPADQYMQDMPSAQLVRDAVYSVATALNDMHKDKCGGQPGLCPEMETIDGKELTEYLYKVSFYDDNGYLFKFDSYGDAPPRYTIANYQKDEESDEYYWRTVGTYIQSGDSPAVLELNRTIMKFKHNETKFPESVCSTPCLPGQTKVMLNINRCCWSCFNCTEYQFISEDHGCSDCPKGYIPNKNKSYCEEIPEMYMSYRNAYAIGCIAFAVLGIVASTAVSVVFWLYWDTPIIKASARELSALLLLGIFISYLVTFVIVSQPTRGSCAAVRFFLGLCYAVSYSAIVVKTRRIARIFERRGRRQKPKYTSPQSQLMIAAGLISLEVIINATWLMYDFPDTAHHFPTRVDNILICSGSDLPSYLLGLFYPFMLMIVCTVYAFKTRKCPDGFNEARHITFSNFTTLVIWLAFLPTFILHPDHNIRTAMLSLLLSLSATVQIVCLFVPKAYVAILQPQNNTKDVVMGHVGGTSSSGYQTSST